MRSLLRWKQRPDFLPRQLILPPVIPKAPTMHISLPKYPGAYRRDLRPFNPYIKGVSLVELLVGIAIGLLTVAVAMGALMSTRSVTATVGDSSQLQQQSSYVFRIFAQQLRQAGSMRLNLAANKSESEPIEINDHVAFETTTEGFNPKQDILSGSDNPGNNEFQLSVGYRNYKEMLHIATSDDSRDSLMRNCLGQASSDNNPNLVQSHFVLRNNTLLCAGEDKAKTQPIASNVANFQVRYLLQSDPYGDPKIQYVTAAEANNQWHNVFGVEVCLTLFGNEPIDMPAGSSYTDCPAADGSTAQIDMTNLPASRKNRAHKTFRSVFQLRSQGLLQASY